MDTILKDNNITLCAIVAMAENGVIGRDNSLIWHIPEDLKHFKRTTMGKPMIMGRKSFESLPGMLPGRPHIVISRAATPANSPLTTNLHYVKSIESGIKVAQDLARGTGTDEIFITGGGEIYRQTLPVIQRLYLTVIHKTYEGDTAFPALNWEEWIIRSEDHHDANGSTPAFTIYTLDRKNP